MLNSSKFACQNTSNSLPAQPRLVSSSEVLLDEESNLPTAESANCQNWQSIPTNLEFDLEQRAGYFEAIGHWWQDLSLRNKIAILAIALSTVPAFLVGTIIYYFHNHFVILLLATGVIGFLTVALATFLSKRLMHPIINAAVVINKLAQGQQPPALDCQGKDELAILGSNINSLAAQLQLLYQQQEKTRQQRQLLSSIAFRSRQTVSVENLFEVAVQGARQILETDRVVIYRFNPDWSGTVVAESVGEGWQKVLNETIGDPCFQERSALKYKSGYISAINNIFEEPGLTDCHIQLLEHYQVKANLVSPIRKNNELMGLLIAHHCCAPRVWQKSEISFLSQLATEIQYGLDYLNFIQQQQATTQQAWFFGEISFRARQSLNRKDIFKTTVQGARQILKADRVLVYRFNPDWSGTMIAESVEAPWSKVLDETIDDPCFRGRYVELYLNGRVRAINNIRNEPGLTDCHIRTLEQYEVKANLVAPLRQDNQLIGLLIAHQCSSPRSWHHSEIEFFSQLATQVEYALDHLHFIEKIQATAARARLFGDIAFRARQSPNQEDIFRLVVQGSLKSLKADRAVIFRFNPDWSGTIIAEAVAPGCISILEEKIDDPCFRGRYLDKYRSGRIRALNDIYQETSLGDCYIRLLEQYDVKANLVVPLRQENQLMGLLIAHQCSTPRIWQKSDIDFLSQLATQTEYALDHISFIKKIEQARQVAEMASQEQRRQTEEIESQLEGLLRDIQGAFQGNLTVRANIMEGDIGVVADFINVIIENMRQIVLQVQSASQAVTETAQSSEVEIKSLSTEALQQAQAITTALAKIQAMTDSIQGVALNAGQAKLKVEQADQTLQEGDQAMNLTVDGILTIQETVETAADKVKRLGNSSQKISRVLNLIRDLASQTHVLALNASIEANGSWQEGQGFAVVAEEVRSLSEQSTVATKEIEQIVEEIQAETNQVVMAMEAGREQVIAGTELVETTRQKLTSIAVVSGQIRTIVEEMAQASYAQAQTSASVSSTMQEIETIVQKTSEQSVAVADSFSQLLGVAQELQESVARFKVNE
ncbi:MAG: GAF domain-containing protein [Symploca sp. SIO3C6]|nr:GAF domain-containing protein [Symploca sp. SIO3C6]